jgi:phosphatidylglycerophosphatase C
MKMIQKNNNNVIAAFDFDGTITYCDSGIFFLLYLSGFLKFLFYMTINIPVFMAFLIGKSGRQEIKEKIFAQFFKGTPLNQLRNKGETFSKNWLPKLLRKKALERIQWHRMQGHRLVLISASVDAYLDFWGKETGFHDVLCSKLAEDADGRATGKLLGPNCRKEEKVRRLKELLGSLNAFTIYAYGDSDGDKELLELADYPFYRCMEKR